MSLSSFAKLLRRMAGRPGRAAPALGRGRLPADRPDDGPVRDVSLVALDAARSHHRMGGTRAEIPSARCAADRTPCPADARGRAFGFDEAADTAGAVAGPLAALAIISIGPRGDGGMHSYRPHLLAGRNTRDSGGSLDPCARQGAQTSYPEGRNVRGLAPACFLPRTDVIWWAFSPLDAATSPTRC